MTDPDVVEEDELPALQMSPNRNIHVLDGGPLQPAAGVLQRFDSPHSCCAVEAEEVEEDAVHLLLHFEVERQVHVLKAREEVLSLVHKRPTRLHKRQLWIVLQPTTVRAAFVSTSV